MIVTVFRNRLRPDATEAYAELAPQMVELAKQQPGFISLKTFTATDGERVTIAEFESDEAVLAWRNNAIHQNAQERGRTDFYAEYISQTCEVIRESRFPRNGC
ncbi:antibiotic biosynthesis monooxygenase family protein [Armatimonas sp.]|uniref:antibiotic biosynthesis monooxygenase family protein n=1 Tax=Armatimonas sp. TaxID=1872638 RepID=UPI00374C93F6